MRLAIATLLVALPLAACGPVPWRYGLHGRVQWGAVNPRPNVVVTGNAGAYALDLPATVPDIANPADLQIVEFRRTLQNGFTNAVGDRLAPPGATNALRLVVEQAEVQWSNLGNEGRFLTIRYRARWVAPDGQVVAQVAGVAQPRNTTASGPRHLEDVVEVLYEHLVNALDRAHSPGGAAPGAGEGAVVGTVSGREH